MKWKTKKKTTWVFLWYKCGKFWMKDFTRSFYQAKISYFWRMNSFQILPMRKWVSGARPLKLKFLITIVRLSKMMTSDEERPFRPFKESKLRMLGIEAFTFSSTSTLEYKALFLRSIIPNQSTSNKVLSSGNFSTWFSPALDLLNLWILKK